MSDSIIFRIQTEEDIPSVMTEVGRLGIGECILIVERHRNLWGCPDIFDPLLDELRQHSASFRLEVR